MTMAVLVTERGAALAALFQHIAATRMAGMPVVHPQLHVEVVGFAVHHEPEAPSEQGALGVLVTPWFMNLVWCPLQRRDEAPRVGHARERRLGTERFEFIAAHEPAFGSYEACSLFSPMFQFENQEAARATAQAVLDSLRAQPSLPATTPVPARRSFLFGRSAAGAPAA